ncbi:MAG: hypothetical protein ACFB03_01535 [Paracoccaceae bacterium]
MNDQVFVPGAKALLDIGLHTGTGGDDIAVCVQNCQKLTVPELGFSVLRLIDLDREEFVG